MNRIPARHRLAGLATAALTAGALFLTACSTTSPDVVQRGDAQRMSQIQDAVLLSVRPVTVDGSQSGGGGVAGAVVGGALGSTRGHGAEQAVIGVLGAVAGAVIGNTIERSATREDALEMIVQLSNGDRRAVVQARGAEAWEVGQPVILITTGGKTRVARAPAGTVPVAPARPPVYSPTPPAVSPSSAPVYSPTAPGISS